MEEEYRAVCVCIVMISIESGVKPQCGGGGPEALVLRRSMECYDISSQKPPGRPVGFLIIVFISVCLVGLVGVNRPGH